MTDPLEASEAQLEALERDQWMPREWTSRKKKRKKRAKRIDVKTPPRDELGRFTRLKKGGNAKTAAR